MIIAGRPPTQVAGRPPGLYQRPTNNAMATDVLLPGQFSDIQRRVERIRFKEKHQRFVSSF